MSDRPDGKTQGFHPDQAGGHLDGWQKRTHAAHGGCWEPGDPEPGEYWAWAEIDGRGTLATRHTDGYTGCDG